MPSVAMCLNGKRQRCTPDALAVYLHHGSGHAKVVTQSIQLLHGPHPVFSLKGGGFRQNAPCPRRRSLALITEGTSDRESNGDKALMA